MFPTSDLWNQKLINLCCLKPLCSWLTGTTVAGLSAGTQLLTGRGGIRNQPHRAAFRVESSGSSGVSLRGVKCGIIPGASSSRSLGCVCVHVCDVEVSQETRNSTFMRIRGSGE